MLTATTDLTPDSHTDDVACWHIDTSTVLWYYPEALSSEWYLSITVGKGSVYIDVSEQDARRLLGFLRRKIREQSQRVIGPTF